MVVARGNQCHRECRQSAEIVLKSAEIVLKSAEIVLKSAEIVLKSAESVEIGWLTVQIDGLVGSYEGLAQLHCYNFPISSVFECLEIVPVEYNQAFAVVENSQSQLCLRVGCLGRCCKGGLFGRR